MEDTQSIDDLLDEMDIKKNSKLADKALKAFHKLHDDRAMRELIEVCTSQIFQHQKGVVEAEKVMDVRMAGFHMGASSSYRLMVSILVKELKHD
jgi:hypothetical protein